jgi:uncharacterized damage-inducible protein DinB
VEIRSLEKFLEYFESFHVRTRRVVECIPHDRFDWAPDESRWSFADLVRHLAAIERYMFAENVHDRPSRYPGHGRELADGAEAVLAFHERMHVEAMELFRALTPEQLDSKCTTPAGTPITAWKWLRAMVEHEAHHRGQIYFMLGMLGVETPPLYGLTSEQVKARSTS